MKNDIVCLPLAGRAARVDQGRVFTVNSAGLAVRIGIRVIGIQYLQFVESHQTDAAVPTGLVRPCRRTRRRPLNVKLRVPERLLRVNVSRPGHNFEITILDFPGAACPFLPTQADKSFPSKSTTASDGGLPASPWMLAVPGVITGGKGRLRSFGFHFITGIETPAIKIAGTNASRKRLLVWRLFKTRKDSSSSQEMNGAARNGHAKFTTPTQFLVIGLAHFCDHAVDEFKLNAARRD